MWPADSDPADLPVLGWLARLPVLATTMAVLGAGLLVVGWLLLGRFAWSNHQLHVSKRYLYQTFVLWAAPLIVVPPMFSGDFYSYLAQGATADYGMDPYSLGPVDALGTDNDLARSVSSYWRHTPTPYGPVFGLLTQTIHRFVGNDVLLSIVAYRLLALAGIALLAWGLLRLVRWTGASHENAIWVSILNPLVLCHLVAGLHNESLMLGFMVAGLALSLGALRSQQTRFVPLLAGLALITLATNIKLSAAAALLIVGVALARRRARPLRHTVIAAATIFSLPVAITTTVGLTSGFGFDWLTGLSAPTTVNSWLAPTNQLGFLIGGIGAIFGADITQEAIDTVEIVAAGVGIIIIIALIHRIATTELALLNGLGLIFAGALVCGPFVQPWYLLWVVIPIGASTLHRRHFRVLAALSAVVTLAVPPLSTSMQGNVGKLAIVYAIAVPSILLAAFCGRRWLSSSVASI